MRTPEPPNAEGIQRNFLRVLAVTSGSWGLVPRSRTSHYRALRQTAHYPVLAYSASRNVRQAPYRLQFAW
ncbi:hypothetical protein J2X19_003077 [Rhodoferax ferrireducens]|uniref:Uncharacterized protein n=1 Tax=Rhodoferax ferrireducens TaxID=192843 RepID=A0ABU2CAQ7_9BURK|nr:hypothetical protein [Rhodoferax ferrireducens]